MKRRTFIKQSCITCSGLMAMGALSSLIESCASMPMHKVANETEMIEVPKEKFLTSNVVLVRIPWLSNDVLLVKKSESEYKALFMKCSHQDQILSATNSGLFCVAHGSEFDLDGNVKKEPATQPLKTFKTSVSEGIIKINLKS